MEITYSKRYVIKEPITLTDREKKAGIEALKDAFDFSYGSLLGLWGMSKPISLGDAFKLTLAVEIEKMEAEQGA